ncbi:hypothetical protein V8C34DRAFT_160629 [Trichoderma compactum]
MLVCLAKTSQCGLLALAGCCGVVAFLSAACSSSYQLLIPLVQMLVRVNVMEGSLEAVAAKENRSYRFSWHTESLERQLRELPPPKA